MLEFEQPQLDSMWSCVESITRVSSQKRIARDLYARAWYFHFKGEPYVDVFMSTAVSWRQEAG